MNDGYLADRIKKLAGPIVAFRDHFMTQVLPAFGDIDARAEKIGDVAFHDAMSQPASEYGDIDPASVAEATTEYSYDWWTMMTSLRQSMLNLAAAGLYHLLEQQLAVLTQDGLFDEAVKDTKLSVVKDWYRDNLTINLEAIPSWGKVDEFRMVANTVKHGEGGSARTLRGLRPDLFANPAYNAIYDSEGITLEERIANERTTAPLSGEDFFVTQPALTEYAECAIRFLGEIAEVFDDRERAFQQEMEERRKTNE